MNVTSIRISDFDYPLPPGRIASHPCEPRDACKLFCVDAAGRSSHHIFTSLASLLPQGALMVCNNTRVINARIAMRKATGAAIEIFCLEPEQPRDYEQAFAARSRCVWNCLVGNLKKWKGEEPLCKELTTASGRSVILVARRLEANPDGSHQIEFRWDDPEVSLASIIEAAGNIPIPPYLGRDSEQADTSDYQTVYARVKGSVAAPTAGLHFTPAVLESLAGAGIERRELTLHVGAGTFKPVKSETIGGHPMHTETFSVSRDLVQALIEAVQTGRPLIAVGTTTVRTLESLPYIGRHLSRGEEPHVGQWEAYDGEEFSTAEALKAIISSMDACGCDSLTASTAIMIAPGFNWRIVKGMVTNFHQPQSTLLLLVSSFLQREGGSGACWRDLYSEALEKDYRFLSYGDAMLLL